MWTPSAKESLWLERIDAAIAGMPPDDVTALSESRETYGALFRDDSYGL